MPDEGRYDLSFQELGHIPQQVFDFPEITSLDLTGNQLEEFPARLKELAPSTTLEGEKQSVVLVWIPYRV